MDGYGFKKLLDNYDKFNHQINRLFKQNKSIKIF